MTVDFLLTSLTQVISILIALQTILDFVRLPDRARLDVVFLFSDLGLIVLTQWITEIAGSTLPWTGILGSFLLVSLPYLSLRVVNDLLPISRPVSWFALAGMIFSWVAVLFAPSPMPSLFVVPVVFYFAFIEIFVAVVLIRGAFYSTGLSHNRLLLAGSGSILLAMVVIFAGAIALLPAASWLLTPLSQLSGLLCVVSYYLGFSPPNWLRRIWQLEEVYRYLKGPVKGSSQESLNNVLIDLCQASVRAVGGLAAVIVQPEDEHGRLVVKISGMPEMIPVSKVLEEPVSAMIKRSRKAQLIDFQAKELKLFYPSIAGCKALLAAPIATPLKQWGILLVFVRRVPLFVTDYLAFLSLITQQTAISLGYIDLLAGLEKRVAERTEELAQVVREMQAEIAARKQAEEAIQKLHEELRRHALELEASNKELEAFAYTASHDLRAPLRIIESFSRLLEEQHSEKLDPSGLDYLKRIRGKARHMGLLIDGLLAFARLDRQGINKEPVQLESLVREVLQELEQEQEGRQIEIHIGKLPVCQGDPLLLRQVFANLLSNALKFTRDQPNPVIRVDCMVQEGEQVIFVEDNGVGFNMQYADKLFGVFQRLHGASEFEGTGVGLANVKRIIQRHEGRVWAIAVEGKGATFFLTLGKNCENAEQRILELGKADPLR